MSLTLEYRTNPSPRSRRGLFPGVPSWSPTLPDPTRGTTGHRTVPRPGESPDPSTTKTRNLDGWNRP